MFHVKRKGVRKMVYVYDFCGLCADDETVKLSLFDVDTDNFVSTVVLNDAKTSCKTLSAVCGYAYVEQIYTCGDVISVKARVHSCDL